MSHVRARARLTLRRLEAYARGRFSIDTRTLAAFRIAAGLLIVADILARSRRFTEFYTEDGVVPQSLAQEHLDGAAFSVFFLTTNPHVTALLFALHVLVALQLIVGYKTRLATIVSFLFVISLDHRNPLILSYADALFRLLLFWAIFLPLGERWSVDAVHQNRAPRTKVLNLASAAILLQMLYMYVGNGVQKAAGELWMRGEATPLIFGLDHVTWGLAPLLREYPTLLSIGGWIWFGMLIYVSWLLVLTAGRVRMSIVGMFVLVHASFALTVRIGAFPYVAIAGVALFLQPPFWEDLERLAIRLDGGRLAPLRGHLVVLAEWFPRFDPELPTPRRALTITHHSIVTIAVLVILVLPPLSFLQRSGLVTYGVERLERPLTSVARTLAVHQPPWTVFAPTPRTNDRYYVFAAETDHGEMLDLYSGRSLAWDRPHDDLQRQFRTYRDRFYMEQIEFHEERHRAPEELTLYLCRRWDETYGVTLTQINIYVVSEQVTRETIADPDEREQTVDLLYNHTCHGV